MVRAPPCHGGGRGFESHPGRFKDKLINRLLQFAGVAELADAQDLKSCGTNLPYRFDSGRRHYLLRRGNVDVYNIPLFSFKIFPLFHKAD